MAAATKGPFPLSEAFFLFRFIKIPYFTQTTARCVIFYSIKSCSYKNFNIIFEITKLTEHDLVESHLNSFCTFFFQFCTTIVVPDTMKYSTNLNTDAKNV